MNSRLVDLEQIIRYLEQTGYQFEIIGNKNINVDSFSSPLNLKSNSVYWINHKNTQLFKTAMPKSIIVTNTNQVKLNLEEFAYIITKDDRGVFFSILNEFFSEHSSFLMPDKNSQQFIEFCITNSIHVDRKVILGENIIIYPNVVILGKVEIGDNTVIGPGTVIGFDGFGYTKSSKGNLTKIVHFGGVRIGKNVEIGANSCIDRGTLDDTIIGNNVKIDNLVHIAHNVMIEDNVSVIANSMIAGGTRIGRNTHISPSSSILNKLNIGSNSFIGMGSVVIRNVLEGEKVVGNPSRVIPF